MKEPKTSRRFSKRTEKRVVLLKELSKGKTVAEASKIAGYAHPAAASNAVRSMRERFTDKLSELNWGPEHFVEKHLVPMLQRKETLFFASNGIVMDKRVVEDTAAQQRAGDMYLKIVGGYAPTEVQHSGRIVHEMTEAEKEEAMGSLERLQVFDSECETPLLAESVED